MATGRRRGRAIIYLALILILLVVLAAVFLLRGNPFGSNTASVKTPSGASGLTPVAVATKPVSRGNIVVTTQDVRRGQELKDELLALVPMAAGDVSVEQFFTDKKDVVGSRAKVDMKAHTAVTRTKVVLAQTTGSVPPSFEIPAGKVAIAIPVSQMSSVAYGIQKGDRVNLIVSLLMLDLDTTFQTTLPNRTGTVVSPGPTPTTVTAALMGPAGFDTGPADAATFLGRIEMDPSLNNPVFLLPSEPQRPRLVSQTLIQDAMVLQMGEFSTLPAPQPTPIGQPTPTRSAQQPAPQTVAALPTVVTLVVSPQDAVSINYLMLAGANLNMVLRSAGDDQVKDTEAATLQFILDQYRIPNPAKLPYGLAPRMDNFPSVIPAYPESGAPVNPSTGTGGGTGEK